MNMSAQHILGTWSSDTYFLSSKKSATLLSSGHKLATMYVDYFMCAAAACGPSIVVWRRNDLCAMFCIIGSSRTASWYAYLVMGARNVKCWFRELHGMASSCYLT
jgi:hypothetical protein